MEPRYFQLREHIGVTADGNLEPLVEKSLTLAVPVAMGGDVVDQSYSITIVPAGRLAAEDSARIIPGTRMIESQDARINLALAAEGVFEEIDKPTKVEQDKAAKALTDAKQEAGTHNGDPDTTNPDNPVTDTPKEA